MVDRVVIPKKELLHQIKKFLKNKERGISIKLFADLCGYSQIHIWDVFIYESEPMTEIMQRRVSKAFRSYQRGEIAVMENKDKTKFLEYRKEPKPALRRSLGLQVVDGEIKISVGIKNKHDYSGLTLDEQLERG